MKLKYLIRGHVGDRSVEIRKGEKTLSWGGKGLTHILHKYQRNWLDMEVKNTTKSNTGMTIINLK